MGDWWEKLGGIEDKKYEPHNFIGLGGSVPMDLRLWFLSADPSHEALYAVDGYVLGTPDKNKAERFGEASIKLLRKTIPEAKFHPIQETLKDVVAGVQDSIECLLAVAVDYDFEVVPLKDGAETIRLINVRSISLRNMVLKSGAK